MVTESTSQTILEPMQELLTVHGTTQGESSDAVSIYTASTSVSGNGKFSNSLSPSPCHSLFLSLPRETLKYIKNIENLLICVAYFRIQFE